LEAHEPAPQPCVQEPITDLFFKQLTSIVRGESLYEEPLAEIGTFDLVWLALKTLSIYVHSDQDKKEQLEEVIEAIFNHFSKATDDSQPQSGCMPFLQFMYLGAYRAFIQYKKAASSHCISPSDFVHMLLVLASNDGMVDNETRSLILVTLEKELASYISNLLFNLEWKDFAIYYVMSIPQTIFKNVISLVFTNWRLVQYINCTMIDGLKGWTYIKTRFEVIGFHGFQDALICLLKKLVLSERT
jgi:hypothetical protein